MNKLKWSISTVNWLLLWKKEHDRRHETDFTLWRNVKGTETCDWHWKVGGIAHSSCSGTGVSPTSSGSSLLKLSTARYFCSSAVSFWFSSLLKIKNWWVVYALQCIVNVLLERFNLTSGKLKFRTNWFEFSLIWVCNTKVRFKIPKVTVKQMITLESGEMRQQVFGKLSDKNSMLH